MKEVIIIGGGLAGAEAAYQIGKQGIPVKLYEKRPHNMTEAHKTGGLGELVCSNSLRANNVENAVGLLKEEMRRLDSLIMKAADANSVPAGGALAVDRADFSKYIEDTLNQLDSVEIIREELSQIPHNDDTVVIVATGPLTSGDIADEIASLAGNDNLYFYDAIAPIINVDSINMDKAFLASRYDKGEASYINCPMTEEEYYAFYNALREAETFPVRNFEKKIFFDGCMPIEEFANRGPLTMAFGPMKPVGLIDNRTGKESFAVVQLRQDNTAASLYNIVGFQTHLLKKEQERVFRMIPGLENAEFYRYGMIHRNTYINSPKHLMKTMQYKGRDNLYFAGQLTGVEGYVESTASGLLAGMNVAGKFQGKEEIIFPNKTALGGLVNYITTASEDYFQPMNISFGIIEPLEVRVRKKREKNEKLAARSLDIIEDMKKVL